MQTNELGNKQANNVRLIWNCRGSAVLALTSSDTDATNQSYYGEQKLHFLAADGSLDCLVPVPKVRQLLDSKTLGHAQDVASVIYPIHA